MYYSFEFSSHLQTCHVYMDGDYLLGFIEHNWPWDHEIIA